jgi:hypothetical protein
LYLSPFYAIIFVGAHLPIKANVFLEGTMTIRFKPTGEKFYPLEVVGELYYQPNLKSVVGKIGPRRLTYRNDSFLAALSLEDDNPADSNAVQVEIGGLPVGHLSRADAIAYRSALVRLGVPREQGACLAAVSGKRNDDGNMIYNVWLDLALDRLSIAAHSGQPAQASVSSASSGRLGRWGRLSSRQKRWAVIIALLVLLMLLCCMCLTFGSLLNLLAPAS